MAQNIPASSDSWALWYQDTFDQDSSPSIEMRGQGLVNGLLELWARYLFETVLADGQRGFSHFHLRWEQVQIDIQGGWQGSRRLRLWIFGAKTESFSGSVQEADTGLLNQVAHTHTILINRQQTADPILSLAGKVVNRTAFEDGLNNLVVP
jgi:hypothetical protein